MERIANTADDEHACQSRDENGVGATRSEPAHARACSRKAEMSPSEMEEGVESTSQFVVSG